MVPAIIRPQIFENDGVIADVATICDSRKDMLDNFRRNQCCCWGGFSATQRTVTSGKERQRYLTAIAASYCTVTGMLEVPILFVVRSKTPTRSV